MEPEGDPQVATLSAPQSAKMRRDAEAAAGEPITADGAAAAAAVAAQANADGGAAKTPGGAVAAEVEVDVAGNGAEG